MRTFVMLQQAIEGNVDIYPVSFNYLKLKGVAHDHVENFSHLQSDGFLSCNRFHGKLNSL